MSNGVKRKRKRDADVASQRGKATPATQSRRTQSQRIIPDDDMDELAASPQRSRKHVDQAEEEAEESDTGDVTPRSPPKTKFPPPPPLVPPSKPPPKPKPFRIPMKKKPSKATTETPSQSRPAPRLEQDVEEHEDVVSEDDDSAAVQEAVQPVVVTTMPRSTQKNPSKSPQSPTQAPSRSRKPSQPSPTDSNDSSTFSAGTAGSGSASQPNMPKDQEELFVQFSKTESQAYLLLERLAKQNFAAFMDTRRQHEVIEKAFPGITADDQIWATVEKPVSRNFKNWKNRTLREAKPFVDRLLELEEFASLRTIFVYNDFKNELANNFQDHWIIDVFKHTRELNIAKCSTEALRFLRYATVVIITTARFVMMHEASVRDEKFKKYDDMYFRAVFDNMSAKKAFKGKLSVDDFPLKPSGKRIKSFHGAIDLDSDSDGGVPEVLAASTGCSGALDPGSPGSEDDDDAASIESDLFVQSRDRRRRRS